ncbi:MAG TPA: sodium:solute symporter family protein [Saprospiraceae bacterium]|nr:sodium:solute symporter family protein [Saprospiraceae bacterium]
MSVQTWTFILVGLSFALYIGIALFTRVSSTKDFYVAGGHVHPVLNGMATAADWMSAASFLSMAGLISFAGYDGSVYLMGWTGGYVLLALLLAPYLRKFGKFTVPDFIGDRYYSNVARTVAVICAIIVSFTYIAGQMRGVGVVFSRFLEVPINTGVYIGMAVVFIYAVLGGMKGITYTQVAQYCVLIFAYMVPAIFISLMMTGNIIPQLGFVGDHEASSLNMLDKLDQLHTDLGFTAYTEGTKPMIDVFAITFALMAGTAGLPHIIIRFFTVPKVRDARKTAGWALLFIAILYTTAPAVAVFARTNLIQTVQNTTYTELPAWFKKWESTGLLAWADKNGDGRIQFSSGSAVTGKIPVFSEATGKSGERILTNPSTGANELFVDHDIIVLANPEIARLPNWVVALVAAGGLAAALSTAAGLLLVICSAISRDLIKKQIAKNMSERAELRWARGGAVFAVLIAGYFGINPPDFVAAVVALAFGLAAASFFPAIFLGIFDKRMNFYGAISGMSAGIGLMLFYMMKYKLGYFGGGTESDWWWRISPEGFGTVAMCVNLVIALVVSRFTTPPPLEIQHMVEEIRRP